MKQHAQMRYLLAWLKTCCLESRSPSHPTWFSGDIDLIRIP